MTQSLFTILSAVFGGSELALSLFKRAKHDAQARDRGSLALIWIVLIVAINLSVYLMARAPQAAFDFRPPLQWIALASFVFGLALRWYSIIYLGRYFTVNVAVAADHRVIDSGPYRHIRHPSYTGALLAFAGFSLCTHNYASIAVIMAAAAAVFLWRIRIEEAVLASALGERYRDYMRHTKRLIPGIY